MRKNFSKSTTCAQGIAFLFINIVVFFILVHKGIKYAFGKVSFEQIIFNLNTTASAVDPDTYEIFFYIAAVYIVFLIFHVIIFIKYIHKNTSRIRNHISILYIICGITSLAIASIYIDKKYEVTTSFTEEKSLFIENNYKKSDVIFNKKRNLVLIFLESMEKGYAHLPAPDKNLIPELEELSKKHISFSGYAQTVGTGWTQAAHINMLLGLPLRFPKFISPNQKLNTSKFLPHAESLPKTLRANGYTVNILMGSSSSFSSLDTFFETHCFNQVHDREFFDQKGEGIPKNYGTRWGYKDAFIYEKAFERYKELSEADTPFFLMLETIDTHIPYGFTEPDQKQFGDIRDSIRQSSIMCSEFVKKLYEYNNLSNTTLVIVGDHILMKNAKAPFTKTMAKMKQREIYNVFINSCFSGKKINTKRKYAPYDLAPTILEAMGAHLPDHRFALGTSLFSNEKTLVEKYGFKHVNKELWKKSSFYLKMF